MRQFIVFLSALLLVGTAVAQIPQATITGRVTDTSKAGVPAAKVTATNVGTAIPYSRQTDDSGAYTIPLLPPGDYRIQVEKEGFKTIVQPGVTLHVQDTMVLNFEVAVGAVTESITVQGAAVQVDTTTSALSTLVNSQEMRDLPLNGRNFTQLALLSPGVMPVAQQTGTQGVFAQGATIRYSTAGLHAEGQAYLLDGTNIQGFWGQGPGSAALGTAMGVDSIAEFQFLSDTFDATYPGYGAAITAVTRSGTNTVHGSAYLFARNSVMDARNYFDPTSGPPPFHRYQFGASLGGPIRKDKTFIFGNYEGLRQDLGISSLTFVPDANARNGFLPCAFAPDVACNAQTGLANVGVDPNVAPFIPVFPSPNGPEVGGGAAEHLQSLSQPGTENYGVVRLDHKLSDSDSLFARYVIDFSSLTIPNVVPDDSQTYLNRNQYFTLEEKKIFSPALINVASFSFVRTLTNISPGHNPALRIFPGRNAATNILVLGLGGIGGGDPLNVAPNRWTVSDGVSWNHGKHFFQFGASFMRDQLNEAFVGVLAGISIILNQEAFLRNQILQFIGPALGQDDFHRNLRYNTFTPYFEDKYQVTRNFTVNMGLRWDFNSDPIDTHNKLHQLVHPLSDPAFSSVSHMFAKNFTGKNFAPRLGFAWDVFGNQKTAVRGGFGMFYLINQEAYFAQGASFTPPLTYVSVFFTGFPNPLLAGFTGQNSPFNNDGYNTHNSPRAAEYNLNLQQSLPKGIVLTAAYVGSQGRQQTVFELLNTCIPTSILPDGTNFRDPTKPCVRANPNFSAIGISDQGGGNSSYNSLQLSLSRKVGSGLVLQSSYTYAHSIDTTSNWGGDDQSPGEEQYSVGNLANAYRNVDRASSGFDLRHTWTGSAVYELPFNGSRLVKGWQLSLIGTLHSGHPLTPLVGFDRCNYGYTLATPCRPSVAAGVTKIHNIGSATEWFNPNDFVLQQAGLSGNSGRDAIVGPKFADFDFSLAKITQITEKTQLQLRFEAFNIANHTNFNAPNASLFAGVGRNPTAGRITSTVSTSRQIQLSTKFVF